MLVVPAEETEVAHPALPILLEALGTRDDTEQIRPNPPAAERPEQLTDAFLRLVVADRGSNLLGISFKRPEVVPFARAAVLAE